jgi:hypothetical protein
MSHDTEGSDPHTSAEEGHPAGEGERTDRDVGGPTAPEGAPDEDAAGGGPGTRPADEGLEPHESAAETEADLPEPEPEEDSDDSDDEAD